LIAVDDFGQKNRHKTLMRTWDFTLIIRQAEAKNSRIQFSNGSHAKNPNFQIFRLKSGYKQLIGKNSMVETDAIQRKEL